jgi:hypothetical protein
MADPKALEVQKWGSATCETVVGDHRCSEDGHTGWGALCALASALRHVAVLVRIDLNPSEIHSPGAVPCTQELTRRAIHALVCPCCWWPELSKLWAGRSKVALDRSLSARSVADHDRSAVLAASISASPIGQACWITGNRPMLHPLEPACSKEVSRYEN